MMLSSSLRTPHARTRIGISVKSASNQRLDDSVTTSRRPIHRLDDFGGIADTRPMNTLETDVEIHANGSLKLLLPLPKWLKPGRVLVLLSAKNGASMF